MKIAITGGAGFIGSHLAKAYLDAGHDVLVIDTLVNGTRNAVDPRARFYQVDIRDGKLRAILQQERPDVVSHHVVQRIPHDVPFDRQTLVDADVHVRGLLNVLESCVTACVGKIIFASGGNSLYGRGSASGARQSGQSLAAMKAPLVGEDAPLCPQRPCDISKVAGEWYVRYYTRYYGLTHTIFRYADVYGEGDSEFAQHPLNYFVRMLQEGRRPIIRGAADEVCDHIFIDDVVRANLCALERGHNQTMHISSGQGYTIKQFYRAVVDLLETDIEPVYISNTLAEPASIILDNTLAHHMLLWHPEIEFTEGVRLAVERLVGKRRAEQQGDTQVSEPVLVGAR